MAERRAASTGFLGRRQSPGRVFFLLLLGLVLAVVSYLAGTRSYFGALAVHDVAATAVSDAVIETDVDQLARLQNELEVQRKRHELDRRALELVRSEMTQENERIAALEEELRFYRSLMAPKRVAKGVSVRQPELVAKSRDSRVAFRIITQQKARKHDLLRGELSVRVEGQLAGQEVSYPLSEISSDVETPEVPLQFRYFQALEGEIRLPSGFEPKAIAVLVEVTKPKKIEFRERFPWQLQERFAHVGK